MQWTVLGYDELARLYQPPYGDRAVVLKSTQQVIGACGFVPSLGPFGYLPSLRAASQDAFAHLYSPEFGLYYALSPAYQRQGYATEAAQALINYAFTRSRRDAPGFSHGEESRAARRQSLIAFHQFLPLAILVKM